MKNRIIILSLCASCLLAIVAFVYNSETKTDPLALSPIVAKRVTTPTGTLVSCNLKALKDTVDIPLSYLTEELQVVKLDNRDEALVGGWIRRIASSTLLQFLENPKFLEEGVPTMGFYGPFAPAVQIYSCRGSVYWCGKAFLSLLLPENSDFWSATENNGPWDKELKKGNVYNKFQPGTNLLITNYPNSGGAEMRSWCHETVAKDWQKFRSTENYNKLAYNTEFPWMADGKNGEISMNYGTKNQKGEWEVLRLYTFQSFKDGIYRRDAVLETDSTVRYQLADIPLPNGILRVDKVSVSEPTEICLGHYSLPRLNGVFKETSRRVGKLDIPVIDNGEYELAMIPLAGWDKLYTSYPKGLHPVSDECALIMASDKLAGSKIYVTLQLWKKNEGKNGFTKKELNPVRAIDISEDKKQVTVRLDTKEIKTVLFE